jgi:putative ABC transport system permease protein
VSEALLRLLLRLAPPGFRRRHGREFLEVHARRMAGAASPGARRWLAIREVGGAILLVIGTWLGTAKSETVTQDIRFAMRTLRRNPGFTLAAVGVMAVGIGAMTAIFTAANAFLYRPLPFADADRLVMLYETNPEFGWDYESAAPANVLDWREQTQSFSDVAAYTDFVNEATYIQDGEPTLISVVSVTGNFFDVLGVRPALGRGFLWDETWAGANDKVILSHALWTTMFGADPDVVGSVVTLGTTSVEIVGVMPEGFTFPSDRAELWTPWGWNPEYREAAWFRRAHWVRPIARLAPGVDPESANAEFQTVVSRLQQDFPETNKVMGAGFMPMRDFLVRSVRAPLRLLMGAVGLLLLLACTNVANLLLVRAPQRGRELSLRFALGAGRRRVMVQLLTESLMLALLGGVFGVALGWVSVQAMGRLTDLGINGATQVALDGRVLLFALAASTLSGVLFGTGPALKASGGNLSQSLRDGGRRGSAGRSGLRSVRALVTLEVALALVLVIAAGHLVRSFDLLRRVDPGFRTTGTLAVHVSVPSARYAERDQVLAFWDQFEEALQGRPGIEKAGLVGQLPLNGTSWSSQFQAEGWPPERVGLEILHRRADRGYFEALDIPLIRGRLFEPTDGPDDPLVVVINETFAAEHFPGEDPIGQKIAYDRAATEESTWYEIVGIVGDQAQETPRDAPRAEVFENRDQDWGRDAWIVMRTALDPAATMPTVRDALRELDPLIPIAQARPLRDVWRASMAPDEFILTLLSAFGLVALLLAAVGVYGVTAQAARQQTQEIGIRLALGADSRHILRLMIGQGAAVIGIGLTIGVAAALASMRTLEGFLYGIAPNDPTTVAAVVALLGAVALLAGYVPARRATRVDPVESMRAE